MTDTCEKCSRALEIGDFPFCPHGRSTIKVIDDQIAGGARMFENLGEKPVYIETKSQLKAELAARRLKPMVRHVGTKDGDRSANTTRWI